jgi:hypothetical protein
MIETIRKSDFIEGRWLNGAGVSWDIASEPPGADLEDFDWRFATALIERDAPFSVFPGVDRIITLIDGGGFSLDAEGAGRLDINQKHVPTPFPGDHSVVCRVPGGAGTVLNLLLARGRAAAEVSILREGARIDIRGDGSLILVFALSGAPVLTLGRGHIAELSRGDAAVVRPEGSPISLAVSGRDGAILYVAVVRTCPPA